ncbi:lipopolysaccharide biosynthesis protein [Echinicola shivajiensis]|uniref:lipopolysaccharide biosynthesis protein n=1 Tax=Echinicola shivajiensis TaxID=1035916 RepID=UPI001BFCD17B|nr:oligosaccharide flippase family protein [Echinicola shivajiensis]
MLATVNRLKSSALVKDSLIYGLTNALYSGLPILILPLLTKILSPVDYGMVEFYRNLSLVLIPVLGLSTVQSIIRFYYDLEETDFKTFVGNIVSLHFVSAALGMSLLYLCTFFIENTYWWIIFYCIIFFLFNQLIEIQLSIFRAKKQARSYLMLRVSCIVLDLFLLFIFYLYRDQFDWTYRVLPNVLAAILVGLLTIGILYKQGYLLKGNKRLLKLSLSYSLPLILHMVSGYILNIGDRFFILYFLSEEDLGNYAVAYQLGMLVNFLYTSFNLAWLPTFIEMMKGKKHEQIHKIRKATYLAVIFFSMFIIGLVQFLLLFTDIFDNYSIQFNLVIIISVAYVFMSFYRFESNYFFYVKDTKSLSVITLGAALITILLNVVLIPQIHLYGCAIATLVAGIYMYVFVVMKSRKYEKSTEKI